MNAVRKQENGMLIIKEEISKYKKNLRKNKYYL